MLAGTFLHDGQAMVLALVVLAGQAAAVVFDQQLHLLAVLAQGDRHINQEMGISILLNIHHVELALEYADRVIGIRAGKIVYDGPSKQVDQAVLDAIYGEDAVSEAAV